MPTKKRRHFNKTERAILKVIYSSRRPMNTTEIADAAGISWPTAKKYLKRLLREGVIDAE